MVSVKFSIISTPISDYMGTMTQALSHYERRAIGYDNDDDDQLNWSIPSCPMISSIAGTTWIIIMDLVGIHR